MTRNETLMWMIPSDIRFRGGWSRKCFLVLMMTMLIISAFLSELHAQQPQRAAVGTVSDTSGLPLAGVVVLDKETQSATTTDQNGHYRLILRSTPTTLIFTMMGYNTVEKEGVNGGRHNVTLEEEATVIDDVVVIAYGQVKADDVTGAIESVKSNVMEDRLVLSVSDALRGKLAGVNIISTDGAPGAEINIQIRGVNSINASSSPLWVIDGVLMESTDISPAEIESMHILKDASSTAIYGSRGANGVIIVTTKKGRRGAPTVTFSSQLSWQKAVRLYEMADVKDWGKFQMYGHGRYLGGNTTNDYLDREGYRFRLVFPSSGGNGQANRYQQILDGTYPFNTDWQRLMLQDALVQEYRISLRGGGNQDTYSLMASYLDQDGIIIESGTKRINMRFNYDRRLNKSTKLSINVSGSHTMINNVSGNAIQSMLAQSPAKPPSSDEWETLENEQSNVNNNPVMNARNITNDIRRDNFMFKGALDKTFGSIFRLNVSGSYTYDRSWKEIYYPADMNAGGGNTVLGKAIVDNLEKTDWLNENLLYITPKTFGGGHTIDALVGLTFQGNNTRSLNVTTTNFDGFAGVALDNLEMGVVPYRPVNSFSDWTMASAFSRLNYNYKERYLFTATIRFDGSSRLAAGNKWDYFPSAAFAWRISEEKFMGDAKSWLSNLKLRLSAGISGNTGIAPYQTLPMTVTLGYPFQGKTGVPTDKGITGSRTAEPHLHWERSTTYDAGIDLGFLRNRITLVADVYYKLTRELLLRESVPTYLGYTDRWTNRGAVDNYGLEISVNAFPVTTAVFSWDLNFNIMFNRSKVRYINEMGYMILTNTASMGATGFGILMEGKPLGTFYGYEEHGVYRSWSELKESGINEYFTFAVGDPGTPDNPGSGGTVANVVMPGWTKYVDQNGDHKIDEADRVILGYAEPKFVGGFTNTFTYKSLSLQIGLEFKYGSKVFNAMRMYLETGKGMNINPTKRAAKYAYYPTLFYPESAGENAGKMFVQGNEDTAFIHAPVASNGIGDSYCRTLYIEDASYLRVSDITLSYDLLKKWISRIRLRNVKVFLSTKNPFLWTKYSGFDPDVNSSTGVSSNLMPGVDNAAYPRMRTITTGLNLTF